MTLSIIIPNYNKEKFIEECILSIERQTFSDFEIIVVDDCSSDDSLGILKRLERRFDNIHIVALSNNVGVSKARNIGFLKSRGDYVMFVDSDDVFLNEEKIKNEVKLCESKKCISYSIIKIIDAEGRCTETPKVKYYNGHLFLKWMTNRGKIALARDFCVERSLFKKAGLYDEQMSFYEDYDLLLRLSRLSKFFCTSKIGTGYRRLPGGLSSKTYSEHESTKQAIRNKYFNKCNFFQKIYLSLYWQIIKLHRKAKRLQ